MFVFTVVVVGVTVVVVVERQDGLGEKGEAGRCLFQVWLGVGVTTTKVAKQDNDRPYSSISSFW